MSGLARVGRWVQDRAEAVALTGLLRMTRVKRVGGFPVSTIGATQEAQKKVVSKIGVALQLLEEHVPAWVSRARKDVGHILAVKLGGEGELGRWKEAGRICVIDMGHVLRDGAQVIAATIIHEVTHARILKRGIGYEERYRRRVEMVCTRAMLRFAGRLGVSADRERIITDCRDIMCLPWGNWSDEAKALSLAGRRKIGKSRLRREEARAGKRRGMEAGCQCGVKVRARLGTGILGGEGDEQWEIAECSVEISSRSSRPLRIVWGGWLAMSESGAWQEVRGNDEDEKVGIEIPPRGTLFFTRELVPMNGVRRGAMWACVAVDPSGNSHYGESVVDREGVPRKWRRGLEGSVGLKDNGGEKMVMEPGIFVENTHLSLADLKGISGGMTLAGRIEKEFGARWLHPYNTRMENRTGEPVRVVWMQAYRWCEEGAWRGDNVMGRVLGPADFNRWFGGDDGSGGQWMQHGSAAQCDFNWTIGDETLVRWECRGVGRSGRVYHGEGEIFLNQPIDLEMLMRC